MNIIKRTRNISLGLVMLLVGLFGIGCAGTISRTKSGKVVVQMCTPSIATGSHGSPHTRCVGSAKKKKKKNKRKELQAQMSSEAVSSALRALMP